MKDQIVEHLMRYLPRHIAALLADEILALFAKEQEYYKSLFGHIRKKGDSNVLEDYSARTYWPEPIDYAGIDPVKWEGVRPNWDTTRWTYFGVDWGKGDDRHIGIDNPWIARVDRYFEDNEGIVDTEIIK